MMLENIRFYEKNHNYKIEDYNEKKSTLDFSFSLRGHINKDIWVHDPLIGGFYEHWIKSSLLSFGEIPKSSVKTISSIIAGAEKCLVKVQL